MKIITVLLDAGWIIIDGTGHDMEFNIVTGLAAAVQSIAD